MLTAHAAQILSILGKEIGERGVITVAEMPDAIARLQLAGGQDRHARQTDDAQSSVEGDDPILQSNQVGLAQRAFPLVEMLRHALAAGEPVLWGL